MSGLVGYASSDEDEESPPAQSQQVVPENPKGETQTLPADHSQTGIEQRQLKARESSQDHQAYSTHQQPEYAAIGRNGTKIEDPSLDEDPRTTIRNLTLPSVPNLDIPSSPPGTPPAMMTEKVKRFLELKDQGVHFNVKLAASSSLKNPSLLGKLSVFAGLNAEDQYATTLPVDIWDPQGFPTWAFKDELGRAQEQAVKIREQQKAQGLRPGVEFVKASEDVLNAGRTQSTEQRDSYEHSNRHTDRSRGY